MTWKKICFGLNIQSIKYANNVNINPIKIRYPDAINIIQIIGNISNSLSILKYKFK